MGVSKHYEHMSDSSSSTDSDSSSSPSSDVKVANVSEWATILHSHHRPLLVHLNADTTWLVQLPYPASIKPPPGRTHYNVLFDPWLSGPQSDVASWFSTQWHVVAPSVETLAQLNRILKRVEGQRGYDEDEGEGHEGRSMVDVVSISHEFTDHCHKATLLELPPNTPVFAADLAAELIRSWNHFDQVATLPLLGKGVHWSRLASLGTLPEWVGLGRVESIGNALYYHSAILLAFDINYRRPSSRSKTQSHSESTTAEAIIYSPHGINSADLADLESSSGFKTLALLHGLHDVRIWMTKQLNLGALNGIKAVAACGAKYWIATHDEIKTGGGMIAPFLMRTSWSFRDAVDKEQKKLEGEKGEKAPEYRFKELGSGDGIMLE